MSVPLNLLDNVFTHTAAYTLQELIYKAVRLAFCTMFATIWMWISPTIPYILICFFAGLLDCVTAWRLNVRLKKHHPELKSDGLFKSDHAMDKLSTFGIAMAVVIVAYHLDNVILNMQPLYLANWVSAVFCFIEIWSILENESSCNGATWAKVLQKIMVDKTARHIKVSLEEFNNIIEETKKETTSSQDETCEK